MMNCGVDIVKIERITAAAKKPRFCERVFTDGEMEYYRKHGERAETLAGMFAAKEAFSKLLGTGLSGAELSEIEIAHEESGVPFVVFRGRRSRASLSITHDGGTAVAVAVGESGTLAEVHEEMRQLLPKRAPDANKGSCGRVFVVAGSEGMTGAAALSAYAALRCGSGLVTVGTADSERAILACKLTEAMTVGLASRGGIICRESADKILGYAAKSDAVVFGPGIGQSCDIEYITERLLEGYEGKLILDADGINALSRNIDILRKRRCNVVLTPHPGEMSRLTGKTIAEIQASREETAAELAERFGITVVLKGKNTVIAGDGRISVNPTGNPGMATGGTGDVLTGVIAAFAAQGADLFSASVLGTYVHGLAGDLAAEEKGFCGLIAGDVAEALPYAIRQLEK